MTAPTHPPVKPPVTATVTAPVPEPGNAPTSPARTAAPGGARASRLSLSADRLAARCLGTALAVAACDPAASVHAHPVALVGIALVAAAAWTAAPMVDARPVQTSLRWFHVAARRRTTLVASGSVVLAALADPPTWLAACVTGLFVAYLLVTDVWTRGSTAPPGALTWTPALTAAGAAAVVFLGATVPLATSSWARLPAALALAATASCVALALRGRRPPP